MADAPIRLTQRPPGRFGILGKAAALLIICLALLPAFTAMRGCDDRTGGNVQPVKIGGEWFHLEVAADEPTRMKGLGQRTTLEDDGGMLFVFPYPQRRDGGGFVMRDCFIDIDIIYLDANGRVCNWHAMKKEAPRGPGEGQVGDFGNEQYESRLRRYPSRYDYQFAIELKGGTIENRLKGKIKEGDKIDLPIQDLIRRAK